MSTKPIDISQLTIENVARQLASTDGFDYDDLQPIAQFNLREQTRQVLAAYNKTLKEQTA